MRAGAPSRLPSCIIGDRVPQSCDLIGALHAGPSFPGRLHPAVAACTPCSAAMADDVEELKAKLAKVGRAPLCRPSEPAACRCGNRHPACLPLPHLQAVAKGKTQYQELKAVKQREAELQARIAQLEGQVGTAGPAAAAAEPPPAANQEEVAELQAKLERVGAVASLWFGPQSFEC